MRHTYKREYYKDLESYLSKLSKDSEIKGGEGDLGKGGGGWWGGSAGGGGIGGGPLSVSALSLDEEGDCVPDLSNPAAISGGICGPITSDASVKT